MTLSKKQFDILVYLESTRVASPQREIAAETSISLGTVSKTLADLTEKGLVSYGNIESGSPMQEYRNIRTSYGEYQVLPDRAPLTSKGSSGRCRASVFPVLRLRLCHMTKRPALRPVFFCFYQISGISSWISRPSWAEVAMPERIAWL